MHFTAERYLQDKAFQESLKADAAKQEAKELAEALAAVAKAEQATDTALNPLNVKELRAARLAFFENLNKK